MSYFLPPSATLLELEVSHFFIGPRKLVILFTIERKGIKIVIILKQFKMIKECYLKIMIIEITKDEKIKAGLINYLHHS